MTSHLRATLECRHFSWFVALLIIRTKPVANCMCSYIWIWNPQLCSFDSVKRQIVFFLPRNTALKIYDFNTFDKGAFERRDLRNSWLIRSSTWRRTATVSSRRGDGVYKRNTVPSSRSIIIYEVWSENISTMFAFRFDISSLNKPQTRYLFFKNYF